MKKLYYTFALILTLGLISIFILFPGQQKYMAFTLATGIGIEDLQNKVDHLENKAIQKKLFKKEEVIFLKDLFSTMSTGAKNSFFLTESGKLTSHYLDQSGSDYNLPERLFTKNNRVKKQMNILKNQFISDIKNNSAKKKYESKRFYMPDKSVPDSIYALYYGKIYLYPTTNKEGLVNMLWRANLPWYWPKYDYLKEKFDDYKAHRFSIPNLRSIFINKRHALRVDDGLGEYLVTLGIARPFLAYSTWKNKLKI